MATTSNKEAFGGAAQITLTQGSLATGTTRESAVVDNSSNLFFDDLVALTFTLTSGSPSTTGPSVNIYANGSVDGTLWPVIQLSSGAPFTTGAGDASVGALATPPNVRMIGSFGIQTTTSSGERTFRTPVYSVASAFNNVLPPKYSILVENQTGISFSSSTTTTANYLQRNGVYSTNA